jgi:hypothetical protein
MGGMDNLRRHDDDHRGQPERAPSLVAAIVYPVWALTIITIDVLVIWALTAHGGEMRTR